MPRRVREVKADPVDPPFSPAEEALNALLVSAGLPPCGPRGPEGPRPVATTKRERKAQKIADWSVKDHKFAPGEERPTFNLGLMLMSVGRTPKKLAKAEEISRQKDAADKAKSAALRDRKPAEPIKPTPAIKPASDTPVAVPAKRRRVRVGVAWVDPWAVDVRTFDHDDNEQ